MARPRKSDDKDETIATLRAALLPFATHGVRLRRGDRMGAPRKVIYDEGPSVLTLGDFDRAQAAYCEANGEGA